MNFFHFITRGFDTISKAYMAGKYRLDYMCSKRAAQEEVLKAVKEEGLDAVIVNPTRSWVVLGFKKDISSLHPY